MEQEEAFLVRERLCKYVSSATESSDCSKNKEIVEDGVFCWFT
jgi:hypothetical protein